MFSLHKVNQQRIMQEHFELKKKRIEGKSKRGNGSLTQSARQRISEFSRSLSSEQRTVLKKGAVPLIHPIQHQFRPKSNRPGIYLRHYQIQSEKIASSLDEFKRSHLDPEKFEEKKLWGHKTLTPTHDKKICSRESEKMQKRIIFNSGLSLEPLNSSKIANPNFREEIRGKWKEGKNFLTVFGNDRKEKVKIEGFRDSDEYNDKFEFYQDSLRKRNKSKEIDKFRSTFVKDTWSQVIRRPASNATFVSEQKARSLFGSNKVYVNSIGSFND